MKTPLILAIDLGSSSVRAGLYDGHAKPISRTAVKIDWSFTATPDGGSEMDAERAFRTVVAALDAVLARSANLKGDIECVASCTFWHSLVGVDAQGKPTTKVLGWADTRSRKYSGILKKRFEESEVHNRTGAHFHSSFWPAKLLWLRKAFPDTFARTTKWMSFSDYFLSRILDVGALPIQQICWTVPDDDLFGIHFTGFKPAYDAKDGSVFTSVSMASATGLFDMRKCEWDAELVKFLKLKPENLPQVIWRDHHSFSLNSKYRRRWKRLDEAEILPAIGDGAADNIGSGCVKKNKAALMIGTSAAMRVAYEGEPPSKIPDGLWCYRIDRKRVIIGGALSDGGNLYQWLRTNLKLPANIDAEILRRRRSLNPLPTFAPFLHGERSLGYNEDAAAMIGDLQAGHDALDILHAAMNSVATQLASISLRLNQIADIQEVVISGGALRESRVWKQIVAGVMAHKLTDNKTPESSLRGVVLLALENTGKIEDLPTRQ